jgi:preprotein translocase subunit SecD
LGGKRVAISASGGRVVAGQHMKFTPLIAMMTTAATMLGPACADADDIALSLVHPKGRVDIPVSAVQRVDARATTSVRIPQTVEVREYPHPYVEVCFAKDIEERICQLTRQIVDEPLAIVIDCNIVSEPIVMEPLCANPCIRVSANDVAEARALAQRIRKGTNRACALSN